LSDVVDITIIGAGVVGLAIAEALAQQNLQVVVLEKNDSFGQETSSRNSEVIHAGIYYPKAFLKSRLCLEGNRLLYAWCEQHDVPHRRIGKLIVATSEEECADLERIKTTAQDNGVENLRLLGQAEVKTQEPDVFAMAALFSPNTGIVDSHRLMKTLLIGAEAKGAIITCRSEVTAVRFDGAVWDLEMNRGAYRIRTKKLINSAGLHADRIAALAGIDIDAAGYRLKPCKGNYFSVSPSPKIRHLVYPVPVKNNVGLGIHATLDLAGRVRFGPDRPVSAFGSTFRLRRRRRPETGFPRLRQQVPPRHIAGCTDAGHERHPAEDSGTRRPDEGFHYPGGKCAGAAGTGQPHRRGIPRLDILPGDWKIHNRIGSL